MGACKQKQENAENPGYQRVGTTFITAKSMKKLTVEEMAHCEGGLSLKCIFAIAAAAAMVVAGAASVMGEVVAVTAGAYMVADGCGD